MDEIEDAEEEGGGFAQYMRNNPLVIVAGAMILGMLVARFAFLGNPKQAP